MLPRGLFIADLGYSPERGYSPDLGYSFALSGDLDSKLPRGLPLGLRVFLTCNLEFRSGDRDSLILLRGDNPPLEERESKLLHGLKDFFRLFLSGDLLVLGLSERFRILLGDTFSLGLRLRFRIPPSAFLGLNDRLMEFFSLRSGLLSTELSRLTCKRLPESTLLRGDLTLIILTGLLPVERERSGDFDSSILARGDFSIFLGVGVVG